MPVTLLPRQYYGDGWYYSDVSVTQPEVEASTDSL